MSGKLLSVAFLVSVLFAVVVLVFSSDSADRVSPKEPFTRVLFCLLAAPIAALTAFSSVWTTVLLPVFVVYFLWNYVYRKTRISNLHGKAVFISGCDSGLGHRLSLDLHKKGFYVYAGCFTDNGGEDLKNEVGGDDRMRPVKLDITNKESIRKAREFVEKDLPQDVCLWALINNAGVTECVLFDFALLEDYKKVMDINFFGHVAVVEEFVAMIKRSRGRIVNIVSIMGRCSVAAGPYSSSKFAFEAYSDGLRRCLSSFGVSVSVIEPGFCPGTGMTTRKVWEDDVERHWKKLPDHLKSDYGEAYKDQAKSRVCDFIDKPWLATSNSWELAIGCMKHAVTAQHPKSRYITGVDSYLLYWPASLLPDWVLDTFMVNHLAYYLVRSQHSIKQS